MENKENVSMETPEYINELTKENADAVAEATAEAREKIASAKSDDEKEAIKKETEAKKAELAAKSKSSKVKVATDNKIPALKIAISGQIVGDNNKAESYEFEDVVIPACPNPMPYLKQVVLLKYKRMGRALDKSDIITHYLDDEEDCEMEATFLGKDVLTLTEEEVLDAKIYFKLKGVVIDQGVRNARVSLYRACCRTMGRPEPDETDMQIKKWEKFKLSK